LPSASNPISTAFLSWYPNVGAQRHASSSTIPLSQAEERGLVRVVYTVRVAQWVAVGESRVAVRVGVRVRVGGGGGGRVRIRI
jgi:hypothetical protein